MSAMLGSSDLLTGWNGGRSLSIWISPCRGSIRGIAIDCLTKLSHQAQWMGWQTTLMRPRRSLGADECAQWASSRTFCYEPLVCVWEREFKRMIEQNKRYECLHLSSALKRGGLGGWCFMWSQISQYKVWDWGESHLCVSACVLLVIITCRVRIMFSQDFWRM